MSKSHLLLAIATAGLLASCSGTKPEEQQHAKGSQEHIRQITQAVDDKRLVQGNDNQGNWLSHGRNYKEDRYSELDQITKNNLNKLGLAYSLDLGSKRGIQSTPLVVDGVLFFTAPWSVAYAVDGRKGEVIWRFDPQVNRNKAADFCCGIVNRGLALYKGALFLGTLDGRLISLDAATGKANWSVMTIPENSHYSVTGAPRIVNGNVLIGNGGAEFNARGYVTAYDARTGKQQWRFYTVPGNPNEPFEHKDLAKAAKTWTTAEGQVPWWEQGGGGTVWDSIVHDPALNLVYIGVGNGTHWNRLIRSPNGGDNLYLSSIVALDADSGKYQWHFQTTPGDTWDYTATQPIILADLNIDGKLRKVLMQAPKNGFFYVIDRTNGEFISGDNYVYVNWAKGLDAKGRPIEATGARYEDGRNHWITPSSHGGHNWQPMSYNHKTGLVYIPTTYKTDPYYYNPDHGHDSHEGVAGRIGGNVSLGDKLYEDNVFDSDPAAPIPGMGTGGLIAYDPIAHEEVWRVDQPSVYNGSVLSTSTGLVIQGDAEGVFAIRDADNGEALWQFDVRSGVIGSPVTYMIDGEQYISILAGWGGGQGQVVKYSELYPGRLYTFKLGGNAIAPKRMEAVIKPLTQLASNATDLEIGRGISTFNEICIACHVIGTGGGAIPDLARSSDAIFSIYDQILLKGALASQGMPNLGSVMSKQDVEDVKAYVQYVAQQLQLGAGAAEELQGNLARMQLLADKHKQAKTQ